MPAMLEDPTADTVYRVTGSEPFPLPLGPLPTDVLVRQVTLRDRITIATLIPFSSPAHVPIKLAAYLSELLNREIEKGDTYPMMDPIPLSNFLPYWFGNFGAIMVLDDHPGGAEELAVMESRGVDWSRECLGSFYIKPNYPGRSSHVCNGGFLVTDAARNRGVGRQMGECYLEWAPKLGYTYSVFNLVYETNVASLRIWDALGFKRVGRVKGCGSLKSYPDQFIDAIIFGRELGGEDDEYVSEERFDKIRFYLKTGTYPNGSDRAEKSRLRSAATHYRLVPNTSSDGEDDTLMLKGKEVISDPHRQYEIARRVHAQSHGGINKTTATIAERYHWVRIKETVSAAIRNCSECKDPPAGRSSSSANNRDKRTSRAAQDLSSPVLSGTNPNLLSSDPNINAAAAAAVLRSTQGMVSPDEVKHVVAGADPPSSLPMSLVHQHPNQQQPQTHHPADLSHEMQYDYGGLPVDPQIMVHQWPPHPPPHQHHPHQHPHLSGANPNAMSLVDGRGGGASAGRGTSMHHDDVDGVVDEDVVDARLRVELAAEIMQADAAHAYAARRR